MVVLMPLECAWNGIDLEGCRESLWYLNEVAEETEGRMDREKRTEKRGEIIRQLEG